MNNAFAVEDPKQMKKEVADRGKRAFVKAERQLADVREEMADSAEHLREELRHEMVETRNRIRRYPLVSVGLGVAAGACLGALFTYAASRKASDHDHSCCI